MDLLKLNKEMEFCNKCSRLLKWCSTREGTNKTYFNYNYWGKPVPGFGV